MSYHFQKLKPKRPVTHNIANLRILKGMGYTIGKRIGEGTYSIVCLATRTRDNVQTKQACKIINKKNAEVEFIKRFLPRELQIIAVLNHANIVTVSNIVEIHDIIYLFMDYCKNGDLLEYVRANGPLVEGRAKHYFRQIVDALGYLHRKNLAHRDLKCENIFITQNHSIKIGDFGFARSCKQGGNPILSNTFCGSAAYAAPEILQTSQKTAPYGNLLLRGGYHTIPTIGIPYQPKTYDMWALGCVLYIMMTASMPFDDSNIRKMLIAQQQKTACTQPFWAFKINSSTLTDLVESLLEPNIDERATIEDVENCEWLLESQCTQCQRLIMSVCDTELLK